MRECVELRATVPPTPTVPSTLASERTYNPYFRAHLPSVKAVRACAPLPPARAAVLSGAPRRLQALSLEHDAPIAGVYRAMRSAKDRQLHIAPAKAM